VYSEAKDPGNSGENCMGKITDDMLCADTSGKYSWQGDSSGGPLIHLGDSYQDDKLIEVVS
jgi:secreted trypsin-like serine protease